MAISVGQFGCQKRKLFTLLRQEFTDFADRILQASAELKR